MSGSEAPDRPLVSVIMAAYNSAGHIREALESALAQDWQPLEIVVVDDGSTDGTDEIVRSFSEVVHVRQKNQGPAAARNAAVAKSRGKFVANFDSDDLLPPTRIGLQAGYLMEHPEVGAVFGRQEWLNAPDWMARDSVYGDVDGIPLSSVMFRRDVFFALGGYDTSFVHGEDMDLLLRLRERGIAYHVLPEVVLYRRYDPDSLTGGVPSREPLLRSLRAKLERTRGGGFVNLLVSVMIGVYNGAPYLGEAIESVLAQDYAPLEVIVCDDGSTDGSAEVAQSFEGVLVVRQQNAGNGAARNRAIEEATGELYAFLDADDRFVPGKLSLQKAALDADPQLDLVFGHVREFLSPELDEATRASLRPPASEPMPWTAPNLMLIRRDSFHRVGPFATDVRVGVTVDWFARAQEAGLRHRILPEVVLERRLHTQNNGLRERESRGQYLEVIRRAMERRREAATDSP